MTGQPERNHRTVVLEENLPRVRRWLNAQVRRAVGEASTALSEIRSYCDHLERALTVCAERNNGTPCARCEEAARVGRYVASLLPALSLERRADGAGEVTHGHASDQAGRRPGPLSPSP